jgi:hypothetical protein
MYILSTYLAIAYFLTDLPIWKTYFLQNWLPRWNQILTTVTKYLKAKEEWWKFKYFTMQQYNLWKNPSKGNQNPSRYYYNSITNLQVWTQAKISSFKNPHIKNRPITYLGAYKNPLKLLYSIMNLNTISFLPWYRAGQQNTTLRARTKGQTPKGGPRAARG